jgi:hypothetical protein
VEALSEQEIFNFIKNNLVLQAEARTESHYGQDEWVYEKVVIITVSLRNPGTGQLEVIAQGEA